MRRVSQYEVVIRVRGSRVLCLCLRRFANFKISILYYILKLCKDCQEVKGSTGSQLLKLKTAIILYHSVRNGEKEEFLWRV